MLPCQNQWITARCSKNPFLTEAKYIRAQPVFESRSAGPYRRDGLPSIHPVMQGKPGVGAFIYLEKNLALLLLDGGGTVCIPFEIVHLGYPLDTIFPRAGFLSPRLRTRCTDFETDAAGSPTDRTVVRLSARKRFLLLIFCTSLATGRCAGAPCPQASITPIANMIVSITCRAFISIMKRFEILPAAE